MTDSFMHYHQASLDLQREEDEINWLGLGPDTEYTEDDEVALEDHLNRKAGIYPEANEEVVEQLEMCLEKRDYRQDIEQIDDGIIGIPITRANMHDTAAIWKALESVPTPKKGEQWKLHND